jgi:BMFP domain-containing protein YqiC
VQFTQDQISAIVGTKELELIWTRNALMQANARVAELEAKYEPKEPAKPELKAVEG